MGHDKDALQIAIMARLNQDSLEGLEVIKEHFQKEYVRAEMECTEIFDALAEEGYAITRPGDQRSE